MFPQLPRWIFQLAPVLALAGAVPLALIARARVSTMPTPRLHLLHDMDHQDSYKTQQTNPIFADGRASRPPVAGAVARGELREDDHFYRGLDAEGNFAAGLPEQLELSPELLARGKQRYEIYCSVCHGHSGYGNGIVHERAEALKNAGREGMTGWVQPSSYHADNLRFQQGDGYLFHVISNGVRNMAGYKAQIEVEDRWAIVAYLRALQKSQRPQWVPDDQLPEPEKGN